jgi:hypothetical protein
LFGHRFILVCKAFQNSWRSAKSIGDSIAGIEIGWSDDDYRLQSSREYIDYLFKVALIQISNINNYTMKNSIKTSVVALVVLLFVDLRSNAQNASKTETYGSGIRLSIGVDAGIPVGSLNSGYDWNLGGSVQGDFPVVKDELYATVNSGYNNFFSGNNSNGNDLHLIPVKAGLKYFPVSGFYIEGEAGAAFLTNKNNIGADKSAVFVYAPQAGVLLNIGGKNYIDAGIRFESNQKFYDNGTTSNFFAIRIAYAFGL